MSWNNRIMKRRFPLPESLGGGEQELFGIHEVYYTDGKVDGWTKDSMIGYFESVDELMASLKQMLDDVNRSAHDVLDYDAHPLAVIGKPLDEKKDE